MPRNDAALYSGLTSASARKVEERKKSKKDEKQRRKSELQPVADVVLKEIKKEKDVLGELLLNIVNPDTSDDQVTQRLQAVRLHRDWLLEFEVKLKNVLREPKGE